MSTRPKRRPRWQPRIPITSAEVPNTFGWQMHCSLAALRVAPTAAHYDGVAICLNVVGLALRHKPRLAAEAERIAAGARTMNQIARKVEAIEQGKALALAPHELGAIELAVAAADQVITSGALSVTELNEARIELRARRVQREAA